MRDRPLSAERREGGGAELRGEKVSGTAKYELNVFAGLISDR